jgi:hypothetical protein
MSSQEDTGMWKKGALNAPIMAYRVCKRDGAK